MFVLVAFSDPEFAQGIEEGFRAVQSCRGVRLAAIRTQNLADPSTFDQVPDALVADSDVLAGADAARLQGLVTENGIPTFLLARPAKMRKQAKMDDRTMFLDRERVMADTGTFATSVVTYVRVQAPRAVV